jgi:hypothetical protein
MFGGYPLGEYKQFDPINKNLDWNWFFLLGTIIRLDF